MKTVTQIQCVFMVPDANNEEGYTLEVVPVSKSWWLPNDSIKLSTFEQEFTVDIPNKQELASLAVKTLKERQQQIMAKAEKDRVELQAKIDALLLLEYVE